MNKKNFRFIRKEYGDVVSLHNFNMPFYWNKEHKEVKTKDANYFISTWSTKESIMKEVEKESMWRDYFTAKGDRKESNISYHRAQAFLKKIQNNESTKTN